MIEIPPYLEKGDTIGIVAPAGYMPFEKVEACLHALENWGYTVRLGNTIHSTSQNYFSGTDEERLLDLQQMLDDNEVAAILCARGGYGTSRIIDRLSFKKFKKAPKWIVGFSDITVLHSHIFSKYKIASLHAPMAAAFNNGEGNNEYIRSLKGALEGKPSVYHGPANPYNKTGEAEGILAGGNLTLLTHLIATDSDLTTKNKILFIEEVGEYWYQVDRMLLQLQRSGKLRKLAGLIVGGFTDCKDTERPFGKTIYEMIQGYVQDYKYPVCFDFPVSHAKENYALKIGVEHRLSVSDSMVLLEEVSV